MLDRETADCELNELPSDFAVGTSVRPFYQGRCTVKPSFKRERESRFPKDFPQHGDGALAGSLGTGKSLD
jgi:hypothetical protein